MTSERQANTKHQENEKKASDGHCRISRGGHEPKAENFAAILDTSQESFLVRDELRTTDRCVSEWMCVCVCVCVHYDWCQQTIECNNEHENKVCVCFNCRTTFSMDEKHLVDSIYRETVLPTTTKHKGTMNTFRLSGHSSWVAVPVCLKNSLRPDAFLVVVVRW